MSPSLKFIIALTSAVVLLCTIAACSPLQTINALTPDNTYTLTENLAYGSGSRQQLDIYAPVNAKTLVPVVVFFYGGNWNSGNRKDYKFVGEALASRGMLAVVADYRLYPEVRYPAFLEDSAAAVAWTARQVQRYGGDPKHMFVMGHSAGGYNAAMVALDSRWLTRAGTTPSMLRGWIGLAGPYDFLPIENEGAKPVFFAPDTPLESQPIVHVTADAPPTLLIASNKDRLVNPVRNTGGLARKLRAAGVDVKEVYTDHTSHTSLIGSLARPLRGLAPTLDTIEAFVKSDGARLAPSVSVQSLQQAR
ncbi:MAG: alpha/beta hydrolase [Burkholderiaceae bacterium]